MSDIERRPIENKNGLSILSQRILNPRILKARIRLDRYLLSKAYALRRNAQSPTYLARLQPPQGMNPITYLRILYITQWYRANLRQLTHEGMPRHNGNTDHHCNALLMAKNYIHEFIDHLMPFRDHPKVAQYRHALREYVIQTKPRYGHLPMYCCVRTMCDLI
jgi:hypothetical protein